MDVLDVDAPRPTPVRVRVLHGGVVKGSLKGGSVLVSPPDSKPPPYCHMAVVDAIDPSWVRVVTELTYVRFAVWVPRRDLEFLPEPAPNTDGSFSYWMCESISLGGGSVTVPRGTALLDRPGGSAFGVMTSDRSFRHFDVRDGHAQITFDSPWGTLSAWVPCPPCTVRQGWGEG